MLEGTIIGIAVPGILIVFMFIAYGIAMAARNGLPWQKKCKSPFSTQFLRAPGHSVYERVDDLKMDVVSYLLFIGVVPLMLVAANFISAEFTGRPQTVLSTAIYLSAGLIAFIIQARKLYSTSQELKKMRLGYEAEVAVGQELNQLMRSGFYVYHDFPAEGFNIDHIVIGPTGVFAVETKGRSKPNTGDARADAKVVFDGEVLHFPHWKERKPAQQTRMQAKWLSQWLSSAVGDAVAVIPVLTIPGWFTEYKSRSDVQVFFGKQPEKLFLHYKQQNQLSESMIQRVVHQVDARCRDVEPRAYVPEVSKMAGQRT